MRWRIGLRARSWVYQGKTVETFERCINTKKVCKSSKYDTPFGTKGASISVLFHLDSRTIDLLDWNSLINDTTKISNLLMVPSLEVSHCQVKKQEWTVDSDSRSGRCLMSSDKRDGYNVFFFIIHHQRLLPSHLILAERRARTFMTSSRRLHFKCLTVKAHVVLKKEVVLFLFF